MENSDLPIAPVIVKSKAYDNGVLMLGDSLEILKTFPDNYFALTCTDPPYGIDMGKSLALKSGQAYGKSKVPKSTYTVHDWDSSIPSEEHFNEIFRVSKNVMIFGGNYLAHLFPPSR